MSKEIFSESWPINRSGVEKTIEQTPELDYYEYFSPRKPNYEIGLYVQQSGFNVPLIQNMNQYQEAFDKNEIIIRPESSNDYKEKSHFSDSQLSYSSFSTPLEIPDAPKIVDSTRLYRQAIRQALRNGEINAQEFAAYLTGHWTFEAINLNQIAHQYNIQKFHEIPSYASIWQNIKGIHFKILADPNVKGRFHFRVKSDDEDFDRNYVLDRHQHNQRQMLYLPNQGFIPQPLIETYRQISQLPRFDQTQNPLIELVLNNQNQIYFLRYLKTKNQIDYIEPFVKRPHQEDKLTIDDVRGITPLSGRNYRLIFQPNLYSQAFKNQALLFPYHVNDYFLYHSSQTAEVVFCYNRANYRKDFLYNSSITINFNQMSSLKNSIYMLNKISSILSKIQAWCLDNHKLNPDQVKYIDINLISDGRLAVIESDWQLKTTTYEQLILANQKPPLETINQKNKKFFWF